MGNVNDSFRASLTSWNNTLVQQNRVIRIALVGDPAAGKSCFQMTCVRAFTQDYYRVVGAIGANGGAYSRTTCRVHDVQVLSNIVLRDTAGLDASDPLSQPALEAIIRGVRNDTGVDNPADGAGLRAALVDPQNEDRTKKVDIIALVISPTRLSQTIPGKLWNTYAVESAPRQRIENILAWLRTRTAQAPLVVYTRKDESKLGAEVLLPLFENYVGIGSSRLLTAYHRQPDGESDNDTDFQALDFLREAVSRVMTSP